MTEWSLNFESQLKSVAWGSGVDYCYIKRSFQHLSARHHFTSAVLSDPDKNVHRRVWENLAPPAWPGAGVQPGQVHWPRRRFSELSVSVWAAWVLNRSAVAHYNILHISRHRWQTPGSSSLALSWGIPGLVTTILSSPLWPPHDLPLELSRVCPSFACILTTVLQKSIFK